MKKLLHTSLIVTSVLTTFAFCSLFTACGSTPKASDSSAQASASRKNEAVSWTDESVPSLKETFACDFDYIGFAVPGSKFNIKTTQQGLSKHVNSITMENEFKPQFICGWWGNNGQKSGTFTSSNGVTIETPRINVNALRSYLGNCMVNGLQMRGHVLVWHSQTDDAFFCQDYNKSKPLVSKEEMDARQEWYIKTVLEYVNDWEIKNNNGKHIVWVWDVVNEACADDAADSPTGFLRGSTNSTRNKDPSNGGSRWYQIYGNEEFIVNAFRYANAYAPSDVKLCYNDYNTYMTNKTKAVCRIIDSIRNGEEKIVNGKAVKPRIDVIGMQSHVGDSFPSLIQYETAVKTFLDKGVNVHVTEMDIASSGAAVTARMYKGYFDIFRKYGNRSDCINKIECVNLWGINNEDSWIYNKAHNPLLFSAGKTTPAFWSVIETAEN